MTDSEAVMLALYGVSKAVTPQERKERTQARVALASNAVGIAAGTAGLIAAAKHPAFRRGAKLAAEDAGPISGALGRGSVKVGPKTLKFKPLAPQNARRAIQIGAGSAIGLQGANLVGDAVANRVLSRSASDKPKRVHKADLPVAQRLKLKAIDTAETQVREKAPIAARAAKAGAKAAKGSWTAEAKVSKSIEDKRQVFGWASVTELDGEPVVDLQGDYVTIEEIEKAAYTYVTKSRKGGDMHRRHDNDTPVHVADLIESVVITPEKKSALGLPDDSPTGWWVGMQVHDDATWDLIKDGKRPMFSIHGSGRRVETMV